MIVRVSLRGDGKRAPLLCEEDRPQDGTRYASVTDLRRPLQLWRRL